LGIEMAKHPPLTDQELFEIEALACDATPGPWEAQTVLDFQTGESTRVVAHAAPADDDYVYVVERDGELDEADQRYIAALHPDAALRLVREIRRLRRVEERYESLCSVLQHLNTFLERRGLVATAQRFVEVRAQLERIHPEAMDADAPGTAASPAQGRARPVSVM
jgi:hypothetical protein